MSNVKKIAAMLRQRGYGDDVDEVDVGQTSNHVIKMPEDMPPTFTHSSFDQQFDIMHLYPIWEYSVFGMSFTEEKLKSIGSGKLLTGVDAYTVFNIGLHHLPTGRFGGNKLPEKVQVRNQYIQAVDGVNWAREISYFFFLLDDYTVFGYRPMDDAKFNMPSNVIAMLEFKLTTLDPTSKVIGFNVTLSGTFDFKRFNEAYWKNRPPMEEDEDE